MNASELVPPVATAKRLGVKVDTLAAWRSRGTYGLRFVKIGRKVFYRACDVEAFIRRNIRPGTSARRDRRG